MGAMNVTICGPNLNDQSKGQFHVHAAGCADLVRGARREPEYEHGWTVEVASQVEAVEAVYEDILAENGIEDAAVYLQELHFFPCCADLPVRAVTA